MFCIHCGRQLEEGSRFCPYCGARVPGAAEYNPFSDPGQGGAQAGNPYPNQTVDGSVGQPPAPEAAGGDQGQASGNQNQPGGDQSYPNRNQGGFDPWAMKGGPAETGAGPQDDPWGVRGGAAATAVTPKKKKKHTVRNVILIVLGVIVLALVGLYILGSTIMGKYEPIIDSYLSYAQDGDVQRVESLFHPAVVESYGTLSSQSDGSDVLLYLDSWTDNYGQSVDRYEISEIDEEEDELAYFNHLYGLKATSYVDVTANVYYDNGRYSCMDFEMVEVDGSWYLVYIW